MNISEPSGKLLAILLWDIHRGVHWAASILADNAGGPISELEGDAYQVLGISSTRLHELAKAIAFGDESMLIDEMNEQSKLLQGDQSEFLNNKQ